MSEIQSWVVCSECGSDEAYIDNLSPYIDGYKPKAVCPDCNTETWY